MWGALIATPLIPAVVGFALGSPYWALVAFMAMCLLLVSLAAIRPQQTVDEARRPSYIVRPTFKRLPAPILVRGESHRTNLFMQQPHVLHLEVTNKGPGALFVAMLTELRGDFSTTSEEVATYATPLAWERTNEESKHIARHGMMRVEVARIGHLPTSQRSGRWAESAGLLWFCTPPAAKGRYSDGDEMEHGSPFGVPGGGSVTAVITIVNQGADHATAVSVGLSFDSDGLPTARFKDD